MRKNENRLQIELQDEDGSLAELWDQVRAIAPSQVSKRLKEARAQFPDIHFDADANTNRAAFRIICENFIKSHKNDV